MTTTDVAGEPAATTLHTGAKDHLRAFVERIERLEEEKAALAEDIREVYGEAKSSGYDTKALREIVRLRKLAEHERQEREGLHIQMCLDQGSKFCGLSHLEVICRER